VHALKILLIRGRAELDFVDAIPDEYLQATSTYEMTPEQRVEWEAEVRSLYHDGMVRIVVTPTWAKLIDFETTLPSAVEELVRQREERRRGGAARGPSHWVDHPRLKPPRLRGVREVCREGRGGMSRTRPRLRAPGIHRPDRDGLLTLLAGRTASLAVQELDISCTSLLTSDYRKGTSMGVGASRKVPNGGCPVRLVR
jgi:hypothetical protein